MLTGKLKKCTLWSVPETDAGGKENRLLIGEIRAAFSTYSSEETEEDDVSRSMETVYAVIPARYAPAGGFCRSMLLQWGEASFRMLNPVCLGTIWSVKCLRVHL